MERNVHESVTYRGEVNRLIASLLRTNPGLAADVIAREVNHCLCPWALRSDDEHAYFRARARILLRLARRRAMPIREDENGRWFARGVCTGHDLLDMSNTIAAIATA